MSLALTFYVVAKTGSRIGAAVRPSLRRRRHLGTSVPADIGSSYIHWVRCGTSKPCYLIPPALQSDVYAKPFDGIASTLLTEIHGSSCMRVDHY